MDYPGPTEQRQATPHRQLSFLPGSLRGRFLTILFGVLLPSMTLFGVLHHDQMKRSLTGEVDETLERRAQEVLPALQDLETENEELSARLRDAPLLVTSSPEVYVEVLNSAKERIWASHNLKEATIPVPEDLLGFSTLKLADGLRLRVLVRSVPLGDGKPSLTLVLAESLSHLDAALKASVGSSLLLGALVLGLMGAIGSWALGDSIGHLNTMVSTAERIVSTDDVTQRVPVDSISEDEIKRAAVAFNRLMARVEQLLDTSRRLLADTSHELRNPLTVLMTDLDLLRRELTADQKDEVIDEAQTTVRRMTNLVNDLLLLSRAEAHSDKPTLEEVDVHSLVSKTVSRLAQSLEHENIRILPLEHPSDLLALLDRSRTEQILANLIENAVFYGGDGPIEVTVKLRHGAVVIAVKDTGCGIPEEEQEKVFERFYRVDPSRNRESGGAGLGLPLARALARDQKGEIFLHSEPGQGCVFEVCFPAV